MADIPGGMSKFAALYETVRRLEAQTKELESQLWASIGDFDADVSS